MELPAFSAVVVKGVETTPSLLYNNLASLDEWVAYVHKGDAVVVNVANADAPVISHPLKNVEKRPVFQVRTEMINGTATLLAVTQSGLIMFDLGKERVLAEYTAPNSKEIFLSRGVAVIEQRASTLVLVGHSDGTISVLDYNGASLTLVKQLSKHQDSITDIAAGNVDGLGYVIASADSSGELCVWSEELDIIGTAAFPGDTVTSLQVTPSFITAAFGSGLVKLYNPKGCLEAVEITAHSRWINASAYHADKDLLATVSEDMLLCLWRLPSKATDGKVQLYKHSLVKDCLLTGVRFLGNSIAVTSYDWDRIFFFTGVL